MALSGSLGFVPLDEVLRLLMRSDQRGAVEVRGEDVRGRIFVGKRGVPLATTAEDRDLHRHLVNSGYVDDEFLRRVVAGSATFADLGDREAVIVDLLREITVESVYQMKTRGSSFDVAEGATSPYFSPRPFELEAILDDARRRAEEWATVADLVPDLAVKVRINRFPADEDEIRIDRDAWRVLSELGAGASVAEIADRLGTTEFWAARVVAAMSEQKLLVVDEGPVAVVEETRYQPVDEPKADQSWWVEPEGETPAAEASEEEEGSENDQELEGRFLGHYIAARPDIAGQTREPEAGLDEDTSGAGGDVAANVEDDTEAFLEKVFSQLETEPEAEEEGHGLLRRRRMGSVLKEED